eukprot:comp19838_c0_seq1/m.23893 comp19838_c0_seq1/g.23893  ORF comp19838_c0_seq1/g.23893 comp19838_c0_seq1/m.23893 type:complete len:496 (-) comp19838_c0_seq1:263-1750(-)
MLPHKTPLTFFLLLLPVSTICNKGFHDDAYCNLDVDTVTPSNYDAPKDLELELVQVVTRHGARSPANRLPVGEEAVAWNCTLPSYSVVVPEGTKTVLSYLDNEYLLDPTDTLLGGSMWRGTCGIGQLTDLGASQNLLLGKKLRAVYHDKMRLIPGHYDPLKVFLRSTEVARARQSAESIGLGLFPRGPAPMRIHMKPTELDPMHAYWGCARLDQRQEELKSDPRWLTLHETTEAQKLRMDLDQMFNTSEVAWWWAHFHSLNAFDHYFDIVQCRRCHNLPLPCNGSHCMSDDMAASVSHYGHWEYSFIFSDRELATLAIGRLVWELHTYMEQAVTDSSDIVFRLHAGHDDTIAPLLGALQVPLTRWPSFASNIILELWRHPKNGNRYVRFLFNGEPLNPPFCGNQVWCPYDSWAALAKSMHPSKLKVACQIAPKPENFANSASGYRYQILDGSLPFLLVGAPIVVFFLWTTMGYPENAVQFTYKPGFPGEKAELSD